MHLLVLDLDETLLHSTETPPTNTNLPTYRVGAYYTRFRPGLQQFLLTVADLYRLAIWTAAGNIYADSALEALREHTHLDPDFAFVFTSERCTRQHADGLERAPLKDLKKVFRRGYERSGVLMLDDRPDGLRRHRGNLLRVRPWTGDPEDREFERLLPTLERLSLAPNVREASKAVLSDAT
jgi:TFIIF-interacting CTD phosphatase-like protein